MIAFKKITNDAYLGYVVLLDVSDALAFNWLYQEKQVFDAIIAIGRSPHNLRHLVLTRTRQLFGDIAPDLAEISNKVLFCEVWAVAGLSPCDRSLVTIASLIFLYRENELPFHMKKALESEVTKDEMIAVITQLTFYFGWPTAMTALGIVRQLFADTNTAQ